MLVLFDKPYLSDLFFTGKTTDKKHRFQPDIVRRYQKVVNFMQAAESITALAMINSLNYELLVGDKAGISSVRVNDQYRVEFVLDVSSDQPSLTICNILELSNHYKKKKK